MSALLTMVSGGAGRTQLWLFYPAAVQLLGEDAAKTTNFAAYLREVFHPTTEPMTMEVAAGTLGHLVRSGGALTADIVETEVPHLGSGSF